MVASPRRNISHDPPGSGFSEVGTLTLTLTLTSCTAWHGVSGLKIDVYKVYDFFVMIFSFETIAGAPSE